jgi:phage terminase large subunit-like protein
MNVSNIESFRTLPKEEKKDLLNNLDDNEYLLLKYDWSFWARPNQLPPEELGKLGQFIWFILAGRGYGKTRTLSQWVIDSVQNKGYRHISLVGAASDEVRMIMIEGESGILECSSPWFYPKYEPSKKRITWPNGAIANIFYGTEPEKSRGAQSDLIWADEIAKWRYPQETLDNLLMGLRLGTNPLCGVSSTPKPTKFIKELTSRKECIVVKGNTYENISNLAKPFIQTIIQKYKGTRLGRQEINAEILDDNPNALWNRIVIDENRVINRVDCIRLVVGVDPPGTEPDKEKPDKEVTECGIVVVGEGKALPGMEWQKQKHFYIFDDLSLIGSPNKWAREAIGGYNKYRADSIIPEKNFGGAMVKSTLRNVDSNIPIHDVYASRGKYIRAEPVSLLYEQGRVHHIGTFPELEDELCEWEPGKKSPNRLDALVWAISWLAGNEVNVPGPNINKHRRKEFRSKIKIS